MEQDQITLLKIITAFLEKNQIPYLITGAWSAIFYGRPRASHDIDFVVELRPTEAQKFLAAAKKLSGDFSVQPEDVKDALLNKSIFNMVYLPTYLKLDFWLLKADEFDQSRFARRRRVKIGGQSMMMASAEDTILQKLKWYQMGKIEKHLVDAAFVYQIQQKNLDQKYLNLWVKKLRVGKYFKDLGKINLENYL